MLLAVLFPLYAPWLNSNYAALQPGHDHLYLGKPTPEHEHGLSTSNSAAGGTKVTNLPNLAATAETAVFLITPFLPFLLALPLARFFLFEAPHLGVTLFILSPPIMPPR